LLNLIYWESGPSPPRTDWRGMVKKHLGRMGRCGGSSHQHSTDKSDVGVGVSVCG